MNTMTSDPIKLVLETYGKVEPMKNNVFQKKLCRELLFGDQSREQLHSEHGILNKFC